MTRQIRLHVREVAEQQGMDAEALASASGVPLRAIQRIWSNPYANITLAQLARIAEALNVSAGALIEDEA